MGTRLEKDILRQNFAPLRRPPVSRRGVCGGGGSLHPAAAVPRRHPAGRETDGSPGRRARAAGGPRGTPGGGTPRKPSPCRRARTRRDRDRPGRRPLRQDRGGGAPVRSGAGVDDPGHPARRTVLVPRGGAGGRSRPSPSGGSSAPGSFRNIPGTPTPSSGPPSAQRASASRRASSRTSENPAGRKRGSSSEPRSSTTSSG